MGLFDKLLGRFSSKGASKSEAVVATGQTVAKGGGANAASTQKKKGGKPISFGPQSQKLDVSARFQLDRHSFTGTMSRFQVAKEIATGKLFGIKFLDAEKLAYFNSRFKGLNKPHEGDIGMRINHERIVKTYEYGTTTNQEEYILMEYVNGPGLDMVIRQRDSAVFPNRLLLIRQMAESIQAVHDAGFIHRDICPRNFICGRDHSFLKMIDFGLTVPDEPPYRLPGNRTGTPQYMAPEIVRRRQTSPRLDIFAFGVTVYRLLTFEHPWNSTDTTGKAALAHDTEQPVPILDRRPDLHPKLAEAVHRCLQPNPDQRMPSCKSFLTAILSVKTETA